MAWESACAKSAGTLFGFCAGRQERYGAGACSGGVKQTTGHFEGCGSTWVLQMQIDIDEATLAGFNPPARSELKKAAVQFTNDLLAEANRIEASRNPAAGAPEVTSGMVIEATLLVRRGLAQPRQKLRLKVLRVAAAILSLAVGFTYDAAKLQDKTYMLVFILVVALAILAVTISTMME